MVTSASVMPVRFTVAQAVKTCAPWLCRASLGAPVVPPVWKYAAMSVGEDFAPADETIVGLGRAQRVEVGNPFGQRRDGRFGLVVRRHAKHRNQRWQLGADAHRLRPDAGLLVRAVGDQHLGPGHAHQRHQLLVGEQRIQRLDDAHRFAAPERQVVFQARRATARPPRRRDPRRGRAACWRSGGCPPAIQRTTSGSAGGRVATAQKGQRGLAAERVRRVAQDLVGAAYGYRLFERYPFQSADIVDAANRERRREWRGKIGPARSVHGVVSAIRPSSM